ncbi:MAG: Rieske Fe-S protein [Bacteroidia bacterium]|jgi:Rieske Fe-S protein
MRRKEFLKICAGSCLGIVFMESTLSGCMTQKHVNGLLRGDYLELSLLSFVKVKQGQTTYLDNIIVRNPALQHPICVFRLAQNDYEALLMKCTHQGTELKVYGDTLQCSAHGSEFSKDGSVTTGPATLQLRSFPITIDKEVLKISLK